MLAPPSSIKQYEPIKRAICMLLNTNSQKHCMTSIAMKSQHSSSNCKISCSQTFQISPIWGHRILRPSYISRFHNISCIQSLPHHHKEHQNPPRGISSFKGGWSGDLGESGKRYRRCCLVHRNKQFQCGISPQLFSSTTQTVVFLSLPPSRLVQLLGLPAAWTEGRCTMASLTRKVASLL